MNAKQLQKLESTNWKAVCKLEEQQRSALLHYLCGFFKDDKSFQNAVAYWLEVRRG